MSPAGPRDPKSDYGFGDDADPTRNFGADPAPSADYGLDPGPANDYGTDPAPTNDYGLEPGPTNDYGLEPGPTDDYGTDPSYVPGYGDGYDDLDRTREFDFGDEGLPARSRPTNRTGGRTKRGRTEGGRTKRGRTEGGPDELGRDQRGRRPTSVYKERRPAWQRIGIAAAALIVAVLLATGAVRAAYSGKALPGTQIGGDDVGGQTESELRETVRRLASPTRRISLIGPERTLQVSALGGGLEADIDATVVRALESRRGTFFSPLFAFLNGANIPLEAEVDSGRLRASVVRIATVIDRKPYAGALTIDPDTLAVTTKTSKAGREVDRPELTELLRNALLRPGSGAIEIPVEETKAVSESGVKDVAEDAEQYLRASLTMNGAGKPYTVPPRDLAGLLALEPFDGGRDARLGVDAAALSRLTAKVAAARDRSAKSASISAPARGPVVDGKAEVTWSPKSADVEVTSDGRSGLAVLVKELNGRVRTAVRKGEHTLTVPTKKTNAPVSQASAKKINRVIGTFTTAYIAGQPRVTNIQRIAKAVDRTIIAPGQQFSLNGIAGERTKAKGYVEAPFIAGNKIEPSIGGGVSQFSTTMYNAAYFAGLQIDAHQPHSLFIDRYPAGRESTLNFPDIDMKWTNDTGTPILVRTFADSAGVTVTLYGNNGGRTVTAEPGAREPNPGGNFSITVTRIIKYRDGREIEQPSTTKYANEVVDEAPQE